MTFLPDLIKKFTASHPNVRFDIFDGSSMHIQELVDTSDFMDF